MTAGELSSGAGGRSARTGLVRSPRQRAILGLFATLGRPTSTTELAAIMSETLGATAHHVRSLAKRDLLQWAGERRARGALQTFYVLSPSGELARRFSCAAALTELYGPVLDEDGRPLRLRLDAEMVDELFDGLERMRPEYIDVMRRAAERQAS